MFRFFRRKPAPTPPAPPHDDTPPQSTSIGVGDLVVCISASWPSTTLAFGDMPQVDSIERVVRVHARTNHVGHAGPWLYFERRHPGLGFAAECFRKVQLSHEPAEECFTASIRDLVKEPQP